jgi:hypothetical protein
VSRFQWVKEWRPKWLRTRKYQALSWPASMELASQKDKGNELVLSMLTSQLRYFYLWVLVVNQNLGTSSLSVLWVLYLQETQPDSKNKNIILEVFFGVWTDVWPKGELAEILLLVKDETQTKGGIKYHTHLPSHKHNMGLAKMGSPFARINYNEHHQLPSSQHNMATMGYLFANPKSSLGILKRTTMQQGSIFRSRSEFYILHQWKISHVQDAPFCGLPSQDLQVEEVMFKVLTDWPTSLATC